MTQDQTPSLRFPEFRGAWEIKPLAEMCSKIPQGGTPDTTKPDYWNGSINWLTPAEMGKTKDRFMHTTVRKITELGLKKCSSDLLPINSIIVSTRAPIGYLTINKTEMAFNQGCKGLIPKEKTDYNFLYYCLLNSKYSLIDLGAGSTFKELTGNDLKKFKIFFPSLTEQKKIAECLSSLDEAITIHGDRLDGLKDYKRGLMQQLFPADGKTTPTLRFREFQGKAPWEAKAGNEVFAQISNKEHDSNFPILAITQEHGAIPRDAIDYHVSVSEKSIANYKVVEIADFIISLRSFQGGIEYSNYKGLCSPAYVILRKKKDECEDYFKYFFKTERFIKDLNKNIEGLRDGKMISYKQFSELFLPIPPLAEQQKIAECLSAMDDLITVQKQKIKDLNNHKNGLMQQLFPKL